MVEYLLPTLFALFLWWLSTGVVIYLDNLPMRTYRWSVLGATAALGIGLYAIAVSSKQATVVGSYTAFSGALLVWAWLELSYYTNYVTGPRQTPCPQGSRGWRRFRLALQSNLYHELAIVLLGLLIFAITWRGENLAALWTFLVLAWMHESARLNVFLGVRNPNEEFVPAHMHFLRSFIRRRPMNLLFPFSVSISTVVLVLLVQSAAAPAVETHATVGLILVATLMGLAILEHWFLVIPLPTAALWNWGLKARGHASVFDVDVVMGPLGSGKTTFMRRLLEEEGVPGSRTVALINDFSRHGVDGAVLRAEGAEVVEFVDAGGYVALHKELAQQLREIARDLAPQRILIEPSGSSDAAAVLEALRDPSVQGLIRGVRRFTVIDVERFADDFSRCPEATRTTVRQSPVLVLNKIDRVTSEELATVEVTLREINPDAQCFAARYASVDFDDLARLPWRPPQLVDENRLEIGDALQSDPGIGDADLQIWSATLEGACDVVLLRGVLKEIAEGAFGEIDRVKGIVRLDASWVRFDVVGGRFGITAFTPEETEIPRVVAVGPAALEPEAIYRALRGCVRATQTATPPSSKQVAALPS